jgi:uncharacterized membrane protein YobD (UPF0266 family)
LSPRKVDGILWGLQIVLGILVYCSVRAQGSLSLVFLLSAYVIIATFFSLIHFLNRRTPKQSRREDKQPDEVSLTAG